VYVSYPGINIELFEMVKSTLFFFKLTDLVAFKRLFSLGIESKLLLSIVRYNSVRNPDTELDPDSGSSSVEPNSTDYQGHFHFVGSQLSTNESNLNPVKAEHFQFDMPRSVQSNIQSRVDLKVRRSTGMVGKLLWRFEVYVKKLLSGNVAEIDEEIEIQQVRIHFLDKDRFKCFS